MLIGAFPDYLNGFILSLTFAPRISRFVVELLSKVFATVPDTILLPWLPTLILRLRPHAQILQTLIKEASTNFPKTLSGFNNWQPTWTNKQPDIITTQKSAPVLNEQQLKIQKLLYNQKTVTNTLVHLLGVENIDWETHDNGNNQTKLLETEAKIQQLIVANPATLKHLCLVYKM